MSPTERKVSLELTAYDHISSEGADRSLPVGGWARARPKGVGPTRGSARGRPQGALRQDTLPRELASEERRRLCAFALPAPSGPSVLVKLPRAGFG